jgi:hypothetical protein
MRKKAPKAKVSVCRKHAAKPKRRAGEKPEFIGRLKGIIKIVGDIESPIEQDASEFL